MRAALRSTLVRRGSAVVAVVLVAPGVLTACSPFAGPSARAPAPPKPTPAVVTKVNPAELSRGDPLSTYYLSARQIHTVSGQVIPLRLEGYSPDTHGSTRYDFTLLGLTPRGYLVERTPGPYNDAGFTEVYLVTASSTRLLDRGPERDASYTLSSDGTRLVRVAYTEADCPRFTVLDLDDVPLASLYCKADDTPEVLAATDSAVWYADGTYGEPEGGVYRWNYVQGGISDLGNEVGWYAAPDQDLLFVGPSHGPIGPTSLRDPSQVGWRHDFSPVTLSSDEAYVVGVSPATDPYGIPTPTVEVRRLDDGALVDSFVFPGNASFTDAWWEGDDTVLLAVSFTNTPYAGRLVRCRMSGSCDLVGTLVTGSYSHGPTFGWQL